MVWFVQTEGDRANGDASAVMANGHAAAMNLCPSQERGLLVPPMHRRLWQRRRPCPLHCLKATRATCVVAQPGMTKGICQDLPPDGGV